MLNGKTAVITGASRGIGAAAALALAERGADVALICRSENGKCGEIAEKAREFGVRAEIYICDVSDFNQSAGTVEKIIKDFGGVDILVNNAGITRDKLVLQMKEEDFDAVINTNLKGAFNMIKHCYRNFAKKRSGKIINLSSVSGLMGNAGQVNYSASKAGIVGLTKSVAKELAGRNVCCNAIAPGFIETDMTDAFKENEELLSSIPLKRMGKCEEVAALVAYLAEADYITGEVIRIDGGIAM